MYRFLALTLPIASAIAASLWLYGVPGARQRLAASSYRTLAVLGAATVSASSSVLGFFTRTLWTSHLSADLAVSLFLGAILLTIALLYAALPPQRNM